MICPHCGKEHPEGAVFCPSTGKSLAHGPACPHCGDKHPAGMQFCPHTGKALVDQPVPPRLRPRKRLWSCVALPLLLLLVFGAAGVWGVRSGSIGNPLGWFAPSPTSTPTETLTATPSQTPSPTLTPSITPSVTLSPTMNPGPIFTAAARTLQAQLTKTALISEPEILLEDDFSSSGWGTGTDSDSSIQYANEELQMLIFTKNWFVWSTPNNQDYENIHMEVTVINNNTDPTTAFGIMCNQQPVDDSFYYFAITPAGQYAIAKASTADSDVFLTNEDKWEYSDYIIRNAGSYRIGAECINGTLTLYVDGQMIDSVQDDAYTSGGVALFAWSGENVTEANVSFDDFLMTELK